MVEQIPVKDKVVGSSPTCGANQNPPLRGFLFARWIRTRKGSGRSSPSRVGKQRSVRNRGFLKRSEATLVQACLAKGGRSGVPPAEPKFLKNRLLGGFCLIFVQ